MNLYRECPDKIDLCPDVCHIDIDNPRHRTCCGEDCLIPIDDTPIRELVSAVNMMLSGSNWYEVDIENKCLAVEQLLGEE